MPEKTTKKNFGMIKVSREEHMTALHKEGVMFFSPLKTFVTKFEADARDDRWEGATEIAQKDQLKSIKVGGDEIIDLLASEVVFRNDDGQGFQGTHVFCACHMLA